MKQKFTIPYTPNWTYCLVWAISSTFAVPTYVFAQSAALEEITVVARKREESLQTTPVSVSAYTADELEARQVLNLSQISEFTPNLTFDSTTPISGSNSSASVYIREPLINSSIIV